MTNVSKGFIDNTQRVEVTLDSSRFGGLNFLSGGLKDYPGGAISGMLHKTVTGTNNTGHYYFTLEAPASSRIKHWVVDFIKISHNVGFANAISAGIGIMSGADSTLDATLIGVSVIEGTEQVELRVGTLSDGSTFAPPSGVKIWDSSEMYTIPIQIFNPPQPIILKIDKAVFIDVNLPVGADINCGITVGYTHLLDYLQ